VTAAHQPAADLERALGDPFDPRARVSFAALLEADECEEAPAAAFAALREWGFTAHLVPVECGGRLASFDELLALVRAISRRDLVLTTGFGSTLLASLPVWIWGRGDQRRWLAEQLLEGGAFGCFAVSERDAGSDFRATATSATPVAGGYLLRGEKWMVGNASRCAYAVVLARSQPSLSLFLATTGELAPGTFRRLPRVRTVGLRGHDLGGLAFDGYALPASALLEPAGRGIEMALTALQYTRTMIGGMALGAAVALLGGQGAQEILLIQLGQHAAMEVQQRQMRMETAQRTIAQLTDSWWAFTVLVSSLESGLVDQFRVPTTPGEAAERLGAPVQLVEEMLGVLTATGLVRRDGERFAVADGLESLLNASPLRAAVQSEALSAVLQGRGFLDRARRGSFPVGWHQDDPELLEAQGRPSAAICEILLGKLAHQLDGLDERLHAPGARILDVGTGTAQTAVELCRRLPDVRVVGLDPMPEAIAIAERIAAASGFGDRIELRRLGLEALADSSCFDFAWVPAVFVPGDALVAGLRRLHGALRPGGWAILLTVSVPDSDLRGAVSRLQNVRWAGQALLPDTVRGMLEDAGFGSVKVLSDPLANTMRFVAGRHTGRTG
jgi:SAM-dependent methyltransferase